MPREESDVCKDYHGGAETSVQAFRDTPRAARQSQRDRVLAFIRGAGMAQCEDVEEALGLSHQSASARIADLLRDGRLVDTGMKGTTKAGKSARLVALIL
jgi:hypothetical protein